MILWSERRWRIGRKQSAHETMGYYAGIVPLRGQIDRSLGASDHLRAGNQQTSIRLPTPCHLWNWRARSVRNRAGIQSDFRSALRLAKPSDAGCFAAESFRAFEHALDRHGAIPSCLRNHRSRRRLGSGVAFSRESVFHNVTSKVSMAYFSEFWPASAARRRAAFPNS